MYLQNVGKFLSDSTASYSGDRIINLIFYPQLNDLLYCTYVVYYISFTNLFQLNSFKTKLNSVTLVRTRTELTE
jgi:hypothetical protein